MINKMDFLRKIKKNRFLVLVISVIVISGVYFGAQKAIDAYVFNNNSEIVFENETSDAGEVEGKELDSGKDGASGKVDDADGKNWFEKLFGGDDDVVDEGNEAPDAEGESSGSGSADVDGQISEEEVDLELEETDESGDEAGAGETDDEQGSSERCRRKNICIYNW